MMKSIIVFTIFIVHSSWAIFECPECRCIKDYEYNLDVTLKRGEEVCGRKSPIKEGWSVDEDTFKCTERKKRIFISLFSSTEFYESPLHQSKNTFNNENNGESRIPTRGRYKCCLQAKCVANKECTVTLSKNGGDDDLLEVVSVNGRTEENCETLELDDKDNIQVNSISNDDEACLDTDDKSNNKLTCELERKLGDI